MKNHKEHIVFAAIITLVLTGIGVQTMRSDATALQVEKSMMQGARDLPVQTAAAP
jgi:hypothetical protein